MAENSDCFECEEASSLDLVASSLDFVVALDRTKSCYLIENQAADQDSLVAPMADRDNLVATVADRDNQTEVDSFGIQAAVVGIRVALKDNRLVALVDIRVEGRLAVGRSC